MADVFMSYCRRDKEAAEELAALLAAEGWTVWYDTEIAAGHRFRTDIETELEQARLLVVLWSTDAVESSWVNAEAEEAVRLAKIVPIRLDGCQIPLTFRAIQTIDFSNWTGDPAASCWLALKETVARLAGPPSKQREASSCDLVVGSESGSTHASIRTALEAAAPGQSIEIRPGTYRENLVIDRSIELVGSDLGAVILDGGDTTALSLVDAQVSLKGLSIRAKVAAGLGVVNVDASRLTARNVSIFASGQGACLRATSRSEIRLWDCSAEGGDYGCLGAFQSRFSLAGCTLSGHETHGFLADRGCDLSVHNSRITGTGGCGILCESRSSVTVRSTVLAGHKTVGIEVRGESTGDVRFCEIRESGQGIRAGGRRTEVLAESNEIESCDHCSIHVHDRALVVARRNKLSTCNGGVLVFNGGNADLLENEVTSNQGHGIEVRERSGAKLTRNHLFQNHGQGIRCTDGATVSSFADYVALSGDHGVCCAGAKLALEETTVTDSHAFGLLVIDGAEVEANRTRVEGSAQTGVQVRNASLLADDVIIKRSGEHGLWVSEHGKLTILSSEVSLSELSAVRVDTDSPVAITKCLIRESRDNGIHLLEGSIARVSTCVISANELAGVLLEEGAKPEISSSLIEENKAEGIRIGGKGGGIIKHTVVRENKVPLALEVSQEELETTIEGITADPAHFHYE